MTPDDYDPARGYDDNPPACLRCDAKDQEIEALRQQVAQLREPLTAMMRRYREYYVEEWEEPVFEAAFAALAATEGKP